MQSSFPVFPFKENSSICAVGATGRGKTRWVYKALRHLEQIFEGPAINDVLYCYGVYQGLFDDMSRAINGIRFQEGLPSRQDIEDLSSESGQSLLVLDDLMSRVTSSEAMSDLFCQFCHHKNISVIYIYLVVDMSPATLDLYRLRTHIFSDRDTVIYTPASGLPASL